MASKAVNMISIVKLQPGIYFVKATSNKKTITQKVVVVE